jgi:hypothetical protein
VSRFGGWQRIDRELVRKTILDADLSPLIVADPARAAELITRAVRDDSAVNIDEEFWNPSSNFGITDAPHWMCAVPERGPFMRLLLEDLALGIDCVVSLAEDATARWVNVQSSYVADQSWRTPDLSEFTINFGSERRNLLGDAGVLLWHRGQGTEPTVLACALMAIEATLYRRIDNDEEIDAALERLVASNSAAIWGVLSAIAHYRPELIWGKLEPLIWSPGIVLADRLASVRPNSALPFLGFVDRAYVDRAQKWALMDHRKTPLSYYLIEGALLDGGRRETLAEAREAWREEDAERWKHLIAQLDPAMWQTREMEGGGVIIEYAAPEELAAEVAESNSELHNTTVWLGLPLRIRDWLNEDGGASAEQLESWWDQIHAALDAPVDDSFFNDGVVRREDIECGIAALLVVRGRDWLRAQPDRETWCRAALLRPLEGEPPKTHEFDFTEQSSADTWDGFCAKALPLLWAEDPSNRELRAAVARLAVHRHYDTVATTFIQTASRSVLSESLAELECASLHWSRFTLWRQARARNEEYPESQAAKHFKALPEIEESTLAALVAFEEGALGNPPPLTEWLAGTPNGVMFGARKRQRIMYSLSLGYLIAARRHLGDTGSHVEEAHRAAFAAELAEALFEGLVPAGADHVDGTPYSEERGALGLLAAIALIVPTDQGRAIWRPVMAVGPPAHYWIEAFLGHLWSEGLRSGDRDMRLVAAVKGLLAYTEDEWKERRGRRRVDRELGGLDYGVHDLWSKNRADLLADLQPEWGEWARKRVGNAYFARHLADFLQTPAASVIWADAIPWLAEAERDREGRDEDLDGATAELLLAIYARDEKLVTGAGASAGAARYLLSRLAGRGVPLALELSSRLG